MAVDQPEPREAEAVRKQPIPRRPGEIRHRVADSLRSDDSSYEAGHVHWACAAGGEDRVTRRACSSAGLSVWSAMPARKSAIRSFARATRREGSRRAAHVVAGDLVATPAQATHCSAGLAIRG
jgi:hypothetical protein